VKTTTIANSLKLLVKSNYYLFKLMRMPLIAIGYFKRQAKKQPDIFWSERISTVVQSPDNGFIERIPEAGNIKGDVQFMHNGIKIHVGSSYGAGNTIMLFKNKGVHEPQEERAFNQILKYIPDDGLMLELGAFWGFYSMTFQQRAIQRRNYLIEPDQHALISGRNNFKLNQLTGKFFNYFISDSSVSGDVPTITVSDFMQQNQIGFLNILHSDIQGFELRMLLGAEAYLKDGKIGYLFISTHSNDLHQSCKVFLLERGYVILCDADLDETYSWDGLIVARHQSTKGPEVLEIHKRK
jgi:hypothetical protein